MVVFDEEKEKKNLSELLSKEEEDLVQKLSEKYNIPYIDLSPVPINQEALRVLNKEVATDAKVGPFNKVDRKVQVAVASPNYPKTIELLDKLREKGYEPIVFLASTQSLKKVWDRYDELSGSFETKGGSLDISDEEIQKFLEKKHNLKDIKGSIEEVLRMEKRYRISKILEIVIAGALSLKASDIHLEPEEEQVRLRYRLDGVLTTVANIDHDTHNLLLSRIKLLSGLKLNIKQNSQDGRFTIKLSETEIEIRTSILPGAYNESIVLRVLNPDAISVPLEELGINDHLFKILEKEIKKPNGMILTTGPTGSGKTTTLYAFLKKIYSTETKILTIENPIEYHLDGIVQTQTNEKQGYTFLSGLRAALRQDPDVIMVGEIRDRDTAEVAVNAALTGHLVFSTLHTNNAAGTFPRLIDLGVNSKVISSALNIALAQRLVRKLDKNYMKEVPLEGQDREIVLKILDSIHDKSILSDIQTEKMWVPNITEESTGYKGRVGLFEGILADSNIEETVQRNPSEREIWEASKEQGILNMKQDGIIKVLKGTTSLEEVRRVIDLEE
ncbi:MAG: GspE/PulE family protein [Candidatus Pacebacteria bacterium]|nr:GspE/PulE family protein [Candidatus Paceibacterota bacterium]